MKQRYCVSCGAKLIMKEIGGSFDEDTGKQYTWAVGKCPNKHWWEFWHIVTCGHF